MEKKELLPVSETNPQETNLSEIKDQENEEELPTGEADMMSNDEYLSACLNAMLTLEHMDETWLISSHYKEKNNLLKEKIFLIVENCVEEMYNEIFEFNDSLSEDNSEE